MSMDIKETLLEKAVDVVADGFIEKAKRYIDSESEKKKIEEFQDEVFTEIVNAIPDEWESSKVEHYLAKCSPIEVDKYFSMFDTEFRSKFVDQFYEKFPNESRSIACDKGLNLYLDKLEAHLAPNLMQKYFFLKAESIEGMVRKLVNSLPGESTEETYSALFQQSRWRIHYYLRAYLANWQNMYADDDETEYCDILEEINSKFRSSWKEDLIHLLSKGCIKKSYAYPEQMNSIRKAQELDMVVEQARDIIAQGDWDNRIYNEIKEMLKFRRYGTVCLVAGEAGSGKSYFLRQFIRSNLPNGEFAILPIHTAYLTGNQSVEEVVVSAFNTAMDMECEGINELIKRTKFLGLRIVIVIDDIQNIFLSNKKLFAKLTDAIQQMSKFSELSWLLTVNTFEYYLLEKTPGFINHYCFEPLKPGASFLKNAYSLDEYNRDKKVITKILKRYKVGVLPGSQHEEFKIGAIFETPLYAHIFGLCCAGQQGVMYPESHFAYIDEITDLFSTKIGSLDHSIELYETLVWIIQFLHQNKTTELSERDTKEIKEEYLNQFVMCHLLSTREDKEQDRSSLLFGFTERVYQLRVEIFWANRYVLYVAKDGKETIDIIDDFRKFPKHFLDLLTPCYIKHLTEKDKDSISRVIAEFFDQGFGCYPLFCAKNSSMELKNSVLEYLLENNIRIDAKTTYSLLYFVYHNKFAVEKKLALLSKYAAAIDHFKFYSLYETVLENTVNLLTTERGLKRAMLELVPCQIPNINYYSGRVCAIRYLALRGDSQNDLLVAIENIIMLVRERNEIQDAISMKRGGNYSFMDFFLRKCFENVFRKIDLEVVYNLFKKKRFFRVLSIRIEKKVNYFYEVTTSD